MRFQDIKKNWYRFLCIVFLPEFYTALRILKKSTCQTLTKTKWNREWNRKKKKKETKENNEQLGVGRCPPGLLGMGSLAHPDQLLLHLHDRKSAGFDFILNPRPPIEFHQSGSSSHHRTRHRRLFRHHSQKWKL